jgi:hypothetical protein
MAIQRLRSGFLATLGTLALLILTGPPARAATAQQIDFPKLWPFSISEYQYVEPTASSGLPVTVTSDTPQVCTIDGEYVTAVKAGLCQLTANQPGNAQFDPAPPVTRSVTVTKQESVILADGLEMVYEPDETITISGVVKSAYPREDEPVPTGTAQLLIQPFTGEGRWEYSVPLDATGAFSYNFNSPPIPLPRQSYGVLYSYLGDDYYAPGYREDINPFDVASKSETILTVSPKSGVWGSEFTFSATVVDAKTGKTPDDLTGSVNFQWSGGHEDSLELQDGKAVYRTTATMPGNSVVLAQYVDSDGTFRYGTSFDKRTFAATGLEPYLGYADGTGAVGVPIQALYPISRGLDEPNFTADGLPGGLVIDDQTGVISGTPSKVGTSTVAVTAEDAYGNVADATLTIKVVKSEVAPAIAYPAAKTQVGKPMHPVTPQITGLSKPYTVSATDLPQGLKIDAATGVITGTPAKIGTFSATMTAKGPQGTATGKAAIEVTAAPVAPHVSYPDVSGVAGNPVEPVTPFTTGLTGALKYKATSLPTGLTVLGATGVISGTPIRAGTSTGSASVTGIEGTATTTFGVTITSNPLPKTLDYPKIKGQQYTKITPAVPQVTGLKGAVMFSGTKLPNGLKLNASTGVIKGAPKVSGKKVVTVKAQGTNGSVKTKVVIRIAKKPNHRTPIALTVSGAREASGVLTTQATAQVVKKASSPGRIHAVVRCALADGSQRTGLCDAVIAKGTYRTTVKPTCSVPAVTVTLQITATPSKKQSATKSSASWQRTWKVSPTPAVKCLNSMP